MRISDWSSDVCSSDLTVDPAWADAILPEGMPVQGNLDPLALLAGGAALDAGVDRILAAFHNRPHVFNLGHGIGQYTPIAHVQRLVARVREIGRASCRERVCPYVSVWVVAVSLKKKT